MPPPGRGGEEGRVGEERPEGRGGEGRGGEGPGKIQGK
jgi:hypothetical protein